MKNILIINGHPNKNSFNFGLAEAYKKGATKNGNEVKEIVISALDFKPNLEFGYEQRIELEPDLIKAWEKIKWANHIVWIYPQWWGFTPAIMKGFVDRVFLPGFAFQYKENSSLWDKLLKGKTAHIIHTLDYPVWYYKWIVGAPGIKLMKTQILSFVGIKTIKTSLIGPIKGTTDAFRKKCLDKVHKMGNDF